MAGSDGILDLLLAALGAAGSLLGPQADSMAMTAILRKPCTREKDVFMAASVLASLFLIARLKTKVGFFIFTLTVNGTHIQKWRCIDMLGIHHVG